MVAAELTHADGSPDAARTGAVMEHCLRENHLVLMSCGADGNVVRFMPPLVVSEAADRRRARRLRQSARRDVMTERTSDRFRLVLGLIAFGALLLRTTYVNGVSAAVGGDGRYYHAIARAASPTARASSRPSPTSATEMIVAWAPHASGLAAHPRERGARRAPLHLRAAAHRLPDRHCDGRAGRLRGPADCRRDRRSHRAGDRRAVSELLAVRARADVGDADVVRIRADSAARIPLPRSPESRTGDRAGIFVRFPRNDARGAAAARGAPARAPDLSRTQRAPSPSRGLGGARRRGRGRNHASLGGVQQRPVRYARTHRHRGSASLWP